MIKITEHSMNDHVITDEDVNRLFFIEEDNCAPGELFSNEEFEDFKKEVVGMTLEKYSHWRWPDEPQEQFNMSLEALLYG